MRTSREIFSRNVRLYRDKRRWTQAQLAEYSDMSLKMIQKIEYGKVAPTPETMDKLAKALEIDVFKFYEDTEPPKHDRDPRPKTPSPIDENEPYITIPEDETNIRYLAAPEREAEILQELGIVLHKYSKASQIQRLIALYVLTGRESFLTQYEKHPLGNRRVSKELRGMILDFRKKDKK